MKRRLLAAAAGAAVLGSLSAPASAHPFGDPQSVRLAADGSQVVLTWSASPDDLVALGGAVGALPERRTIVYDTGPSGDPEPVSASDAELIAGSPAVAEYLADHLAVHQDGRACPAEVSLDALAESGARVEFTCPRSVTEVDVEVTMLTDLHEAYRTVALGDGAVTPDRAMYTATRTVHTWSFAGGEGRNTAPWIAGGALAVLVLTGGLLLRRVSRR